MEEQKEENFEVASRFWRGLMLGIGLSATLVFPIKEALHDKQYLMIPKKVEIQRGYVNPSELEIQVTDLDNNGKKELMVKYNGSAYLLARDGNGKPNFQEYDVKPTEVKPAEIILK